MASADCLVLLSDVDGLYTADPPRDPQAPAHRRGPRASRPRSRRWRAAPPPTSAPAAWRPSCWPADRARRRLPHVHRDRPRAASAAAHRGRRALHLVRAAGVAADRAQAVDRRHAQARRACCTSTTAPRARCAAARACCRPASRAVEGRFERGDAVLVPRRRGRRDRRAAWSPTRARTRAGSCGGQQREHRGDARATVGRDETDPPRRPGDLSLRTPGRTGRHRRHLMQTIGRQAVRRRDTRCAIADACPARPCAARDAAATLRARQAGDPRGQRARHGRGAATPASAAPMLDRLLLDAARVEAMARGLEDDRRAAGSGRAA